ncbi:MAG: hypothetical protein AAF632_20655 [Bacteroidota bacterium]
MMKYVSILSMVLNFCPLYLSAQYALRAADGNSSLLLKGTSSAINYSFANSRLGFTFVGSDVDSTEVYVLDSTDIPSFTFDTITYDRENFTFSLDDVAEIKGDSVTIQVIKRSEVTIKDYYNDTIFQSFTKYRYSLDIGFSSFENDVLDLFAGNRFNPGADLAFTLVRTELFPNMMTGQLKYLDIFVRPSITITKRKFAYESIMNTDEIVLSDKTGVDANLALGSNFAFTDDLFLGVTFIGGHSWNSHVGLEKRTVCTTESSANGNNTNPVVVSNCSDRFVGRPDNKYIGQIRSDILYRPNRWKLPNTASIGLIGAISSSFSSDTKPAYSLALGPSVHHKDRPNTVLFAFLFEFRDVTNSLGNSENFEDIFRVRAYIGVPIKNFKIW